MPARSAAISSASLASSAITMNRQSAWRDANARPAGRRAGAHQQRPRAAPRLRLAADVLQIEMLAAVVERLCLRPDLLDDRHPFLGVSVPVVMLEKLRAEHLEFVDVPARHDVEAETPAPDVVGGHAGLGREHRIDQRHMDRGEGDDVLGRRQQRRRPGQRFEARALTIRHSAVAKPSCDRQQEFDACRIGHPRRLAVFRPSRVPALGRRRRHRAGAVHAEQAELESVAFCIRVWRTGLVAAMGRSSP